MRSRFLALLPVLWFSTGPIHGADEASPVAKAYINAALAVMQEHFLRKDKIDWPSSCRIPCSKLAERKPLWTPTLLFASLWRGSVTITAIYS